MPTIVDALGYDIVPYYARAIFHIDAVGCLFCVFNHSAAVYGRMHNYAFVVAGEQEVAALTDDDERQICLLQNVGHLLCLFHGGKLKKAVATSVDAECVVSQ